MSDQDLLILLSVVLAVVVVAVLAAALILAQEPGGGPPRGSATLSSALQMAESEHLRPLEAQTAINAQFDIILGALPGIASKAALVAERRPR